MPPPDPFPFSPLVERVRSILPDQEVYLVGGAVRDALLGKVSHDLDFAVPGDAIAIARRVANALQADFYVLDEAFDAARVIVNSLPETDPRTHESEPSSGKRRAPRDFLDFSSFRHLPGTSDSAADLDTDLQGRDFSVNSMAYDLRGGTILDPLNGAADLRAKVIRMSSPTALQDDAIRIMRGVRLAAQLDFKIDPATRSAMKAAVQLLPGISSERQRDELFKILDGLRPDAALRALEVLGVFPYLMPELSPMKGVEQSAPHVLDVWGHTLRVIQYLDNILAALNAEPQPDRGNDLFTGLLSLRLGRFRQRISEHFSESLNLERSLRALLFFAALYHDVSKPQTKTIEASGRIRFLGHDQRGAEQAVQRGRAFNLSSAEIGRLQAIITNHMRFHFHVGRLEAENTPPSRKAIYRFFRDAGDAGIELILLGLADLRGTRGHLLTQATWTAGLDVARVFLENYWEKPEEAVAPPRLLDGNELMAELQLRPGPMVGNLLEAIREAQAAGQIADREEALTYARSRLAQRQ